MANVNTRLQTCLTGERLGEYEACREILLSVGVEESKLSVQRVMSASFQALIEFHKIGEVSVTWADGRKKSGRPNKPGKATA